MADVKEVGEQIVEAVRGLVRRTATQLGERIDEVARQLDVLRSAITEEVERAFARLPAPERGEKGDVGERGLPGERGTDADPLDVAKALLQDESFVRATKGDTGERGLPGEQGERGEKGDAGDTGERGLPGEQGERGEKGDAGDTGERGFPGEQGERGLPGEKGDTGDVGERGEKGDTGDVGERGEKGDTGDVGERGLSGERGEKGNAGEQGERGLPGERGEKGDTGDRGLQGERGADGLVGERGEKGNAGEQGERGLPGERGEKGDTGDRGLQGERGIPGERGEKGIDGADGAPGRDALEIQIVAQLDATKSYPRGTFASHNGGLIRAYRKTDPMGDDIEQAGWSVIVDGMRSVEVVQTGERTVSVCVAKTAGAAVVNDFRFPIPLYRGVFKAGSAHQEGDLVTSGGSLWMAVKDAPNGKPDEQATDWRLVVKRGRDGKDGAPGVRGEKGDVGARGRDLTVLMPDGGKIR
jgi:hypothetical protein